MIVGVACPKGEEESILLVPQMPEMKCDLKVWMDRSATFRLCMFGGTSWIVDFCALEFTFIALYASLSRMWTLGLIPVYLN